MNDKELTLFCPVWGQKFLDLLKNFALPSLMLSRNLPALGLEKIYVECIGVHHEFDHTCQVVTEGLSGLPIEVSQHGSVRAEDPIHGLRSIMNKCRQRKTRMLLAMPDTIYGNGSVSNIFNYAKGKEITVSAAHFRVNEDKFQSECALWRHWPANRDFVRNALNIGAVDVCDTNADNVTQIGGIAWTKINDDTRLLLHYLPTAYLVWFTASDIAWWSNRMTWGEWDHSWPTILLHERRMRVVGSTDVFFAIELEDAARSGQLRPAPGSLGNESYYKHNPHNEACGSFLVEVRS